MRGHDDASLEIEVPGSPLNELLARVVYEVSGFKIRPRSATVRIDKFPETTVFDARDGAACWPAYSELLADWQHYIRAARALISIDERLRKELPARTEDWDSVLERSGLSKRDWSRRSFLAQRRDLAAVLSDWLVLGHVGPTCEWAGDDKSVQIHAEGLFGGIARELALALGKVEGWAVCAGCGNPFVPQTRQPARGRRSWCPARECHAARQRAYMRKSRSKRRQGPDATTS